MTTDFFIMNGCVCMPKNLGYSHLVEEYLASLHCYLPSMWCCKLLEKRLHITKLQILHMHDPFFAQFDLLLQL